MLPDDAPLPANLPKVKDLLSAFAGVDPEATLLCQVVPFIRDGHAWRMQYEVLKKDGVDVVVLNFFNDKLMLLPTAARSEP
jgi:hypothetical protein